MSRKASDILLDLEDRVKRLVGLVQNIDNNVKLILDRSNRGTVIAQPTTGGTVLSSQTSEKASLRVEAIDLPPISQSQVMVGKPIDDDPDDILQLSEETVHKGKRRDLRKAPVGQGKKVAVSQKLSFSDGKPIFLASIEIFDQSEQLVKQTRTNSQGKWLAPLEPGEYTVHVLKRAVADSKKPNVELRFKVQIPDSDGPVELPSPEVK